MKRTLVLLCALAAVGCQPRPTAPTVLDGFTQGTTYHIVVRGAADPVALRGAVDSIFARVEASMSLFDPASLVSRLNRNETDSLDRMTADCITLSQVFSAQTGGLFDITVKPLTAAYGFTGAGAVEAPDLDSLLQFVGYEKIRVEDGRLVKADPRVQIDLNAVAQGYTVDRVAGYLDGLGIGHYLVEMGGEIFARGERAGGGPWTVGIDTPVEGNFVPGAAVQANLQLSGRGLATSGNYRKFYEDAAGRKIVHTIDPRTGQPVVRNMLSATVVAPTAAEADMLCTFFMVAGLEQAEAYLADHAGIDAYLIYVDESGAMQSRATDGLELID